MSYEDIEDTLSELLQGKFFDVKPLPDTQSELTQGLAAKPRVYVCYDASDYLESENVGMTVQEDKIRIGFDIQALKRRGTTGLLAVRDVIQDVILGYKIMGLDKFQLVSFSPLQPSTPNSWHYYLQFSTVGHVAENQVDPDSLGYLLKTPECVNKTD